MENGKIVPLIMGRNKKIVALVVLVVIFAAGYWVGNRQGFSKATAEAKKVQEEAARKAADEAAKAANPFKAVNPLEGVEANPFEKTKKVLNPFQ